VGTWGTALYSDDLAADLRSEFRDLIGGGLSADEAVERLATEHASSLDDPDETPVFWLAVAHAAWKLGRPHARATTEALRAIETGADLLRWPHAKDRRKREAVLEQGAATLRSAPPAAKRVPKPFIANNSWEVGEVVAYRLASGSWTSFRVIGHHEDKGGRHAVCEPLDWIGPEPPDPARLPAHPVRPSLTTDHRSQFLLGEPRRKRDAARFVRTGARSTPTQQPSGYVVLVFPHFDRQILDIYGLQ